jgi:predicted PurR-regulated permease PerM
VQKTNALDRPFRFGLWVSLALLLVFVVASLVRSTATVLTIVAAAGFFAVGLNPVVKWIMRWGVQRGIAVTILFFTFTLVTCGFLALLIPPVISQVSSVIDAIPGWVQSVLKDPRVSDIAHDQQIVSKVKTLLTPANIGLVLGGLLGGAASLAAGVANIATAAILMFFILGAFDRLREGAYGLVPMSKRERFANICDQILDKVGGYLVGSLCIALIAGTFSLLYLWIVSVPYALLLALVVAFFDLIPQVGATLGAIVVSLVALGTRGLGIAIVTVIFFIVYQQLENWIIYPRVMRQAVEISNLATIVSVLIGFAAFGVIGVFIAVPGYAAIQLIIRQVIHPRLEVS